MINCEDGGVTLKGFYSDIIKDYIMISASLINALKRQMELTEAAETLCDCLSIAIKHSEEEHIIEESNGVLFDAKKTEKELTKLIEKYSGGNG